jgi:hypothetical protein
MAFSPLLAWGDLVAPLLIVISEGTWRKAPEIMTDGRKRPQ